MGLKSVVGQLDLLTVFCLLMALLSWFVPWGMSILWVIVGLLWQVGKAQQIKAGLKGMFSSFSKPASPVLPLGVAPAGG